MQTKNDAIWGEDQLARNDATQGEATTQACHLTKNVSKAE
jgi:hypothetical protein